MYRKEECLSLLKDTEKYEVDDGQDKHERTPTLKWHKVIVVFICLQLRKSLLLFFGLME